MRNTIWVLFLLVIVLSGCKKYLNTIADGSLTVPATVDDYQSLLDNHQLTEKVTPGLGPLGITDWYTDSASWASAETMSKGAYGWDPSIYQPANGSSWSTAYQAIYTCNVIIAGIQRVPAPDKDTRIAANAVLGGALFIRSLLFYYLEETFGQPFRPATAAVDAGIPLRTSSDPTQPAPRATVQAVFKQIDADLMQAVSLLPAALQVNNPNRPCQSAALALLARSCLTQQNYPQARKWADSSLRLYPVLLDYNTLDSSAAYPFPTRENPEVLFQCSTLAYKLQYSTSSKVDSNLYRSYDPNDLRRVFFFSPAPGGGVNFKGYYTGVRYIFSGIATDEVYLMRAECAARAGDIAAALADLNALLSQRWRKGFFQPLTAQSGDEALRLVVRETRKETLFRELRWADQRRLSKDARFADTLIRTVGGSVRLLPPNSPRYTYLIPDEEVRLGGVAQNP
ncbi:RagB/SusD family nutrient uptake outer membrane protein [Puia dinghuensis]|uniref:SusD-like N-terminal domain-containing protein n=1 Tax=Puia dinghuensis TaxID=1792502 RepID=A0A8J2XY49_9BACT|nr:RagB/SusD family nutrient uptake outer membrane protein [Puia dinghuensis]GGB26304.1 hypothetical protein GCM10011511_57820 [Puia dinghuensis]